MKMDMEEELCEEEPRRLRTITKAESNKIQTYFDRYDLVNFWKVPDGFYITTKQAIPNLKPCATYFRYHVFEKYQYFITLTPKFLKSLTQEPVLLPTNA